MPVPRLPPLALVGLEVRAGDTVYTLKVPADEAWQAQQVFDRREYGGVPVGRLNDPPVVLDVGANVGAFAVFAKVAFRPNAVVHCFEPFPPTFSLLRDNVGSLPGVTAHPFGLGRMDAEIELLHHPTLGSMAHSVRPDLVPDAGGRTRVRLRDAGGVWDGLELREVDVLKLDAEGCEVEILEALGGRISRVRVLLIEYHTEVDRRRIDALLPGHTLIGAFVHRSGLGVVRYLRTDLS